MIKHDDQGFLMGSRVSLDGTQDILNAIKKEMEGLRGDLTGLEPKTVALPTRAPAIVAQPQANPQVHAPVASTSSQASSKAVPVATPTRGSADTGGAPAPTEQDGDSSSDSQSLRSSISDMGSKVTGAISAAAPGEEADPSVKAFNEIAQPLQRGFGKIFGGSDDGNDGNDRWYRRFWRRMRDGDKLDKKRHKEQIEILEDIEKQGGGSKKGGILGLLAPPVRHAR